MKRDEVSIAKFIMLNPESGNKTLFFFLNFTKNNIFAVKIYLKSENDIIQFNEIEDNS